MHHDLGRTNSGGFHSDRHSGASERPFNVLLGYALTDFLTYGPRFAHPRDSDCAFVDIEGDTEDSNMASQSFEWRWYIYTFNSPLNIFCRVLS